MSSNLTAIAVIGSNADAGCGNPFSDPTSMSMFAIRINLNIVIDSPDKSR
jgi:uncharacterized NAD(P)/FAD-binding protein YdhS